MTPLTYILSNRQWTHDPSRMPHDRQSSHSPIPCIPWLGEADAQSNCSPSQGAIGSHLGLLTPCEGLPRYVQLRRSLWRPSSQSVLDF